MARKIKHPYFDEVSSMPTYDDFGKSNDACLTKVIKPRILSEGKLEPTRVRG